VLVGHPFDQLRDPPERHGTLEERRHRGFVGCVEDRRRTAALSLTTSELFDRVITDLNYKEYIDDQSEEGVDRWENVEELRRLALEYSTRSLDEFLENVALVSDLTDKSVYSKDTQGKPPMGKVHHETKFGFAAFPDSRSKGHYYFQVNENNTIVHRSAEVGVPPKSWPSDEDLKKFWWKE